MKPVTTILAVAAALITGCSSARYADDTVQVPAGTIRPAPADAPAVLVTSDQLSAVHGPVLALVPTEPAIYANGAIVATGGRTWTAVTGEPWRYYNGTDAERDAVASAKTTARRAEQDRKDLDQQRRTVRETIHTEEVAPLEQRLGKMEAAERERSATLIAAVAAGPDEDRLADRAIAIALAESRSTPESITIVRPIERDKLMAAVNDLNNQLIVARQEQERLAGAASAAETSRKTSEQALRERESLAAGDRDRAAQVSQDLERAKADLATAQQTAQQALKDREAADRQLKELQQRFNDVVGELNRQGTNGQAQPAPPAAEAPAQKPGDGAPAAAEQGEAKP